MEVRTADRILAMQTSDGDHTLSMNSDGRNAPHTNSSGPLLPDKRLATDVRWHSYAPGRHACVARPRGDDAAAHPVVVWLSGGGLFRINPWLLAWCVRAYASRGHVVVAPRYQVSSPPFFTLVKSLLLLALPLVVCTAWDPPPPPWLPLSPMLAALLLGLLLAVVLLTSRALRGPGARHPEHVRDAAAAVGWALRSARDLGASPGRLVLAGHSAGGQLACRIA